MLRLGSARCTGAPVKGISLVTVRYSRRTAARNRSSVLPRSTFKRGANEV
jgi:hypothetical protein